MATQKIYEAVLNFEKEKVNELVNAELESGTGVLSILNAGLISALDEVGRRFTDGVLFVPEMILAANVVTSALEILRPALVEEDVQPKGTIVIGTVQGDLHDIGKNLVSMMLEGAGFEVIDLGVDVTPQMFVQAVKERQPDILAMSTLLTTTMPMMKETIDAMVESKLRDQIKILVGGAPVTQKVADDIQADGFAKDAPNSVIQARALLNL